MQIIKCNLNALTKTSCLELKVCPYTCSGLAQMSWKLSMERKLIYHKNIDAPGHGKSSIVSEQGRMKKELSKGLCGNVTSQPEAYIEGKNTIIYVDMDQNGKR